MSAAKEIEMPATDRKLNENDNTMTSQAVGPFVPDGDQAEKHQLRLQCRQMKLTNMMVDHSGKILTSGFCCLMIFSILVTGPFGFLSIYESDHGRDYQDWDHQTVINLDKARKMWEHMDYITELKLNNSHSKVEDEVIPTRTEEMHTMTLIYRLKNDT